MTVGRTECFDSRRPTPSIRVSPGHLGLHARLAHLELPSQDLVDGPLRVFHAGEAHEGVALGPPVHEHHAGHGADIFQIPTDLLLPGIVRQAHKEDGCDGPVVVTTSPLAIASSARASPPQTPAPA
eukprot:CAMPEP_0177474272 /NCGR_PEP_ID=MMETSP0369-20130122/22358_1 /TAXON_ID=447022 ORGANISM="Scrippsiella hangoei-like, Strain SHHI-4" /NCGR_SAMPLE_ID=MMETSP0369 /ASSEMBLY_ACC=CAM_ASM_000364 /LENGTH=125 /DNA_ID=CAMNT_0018949211 /DNA_START=14 /DNA_END=387 /DNA_ORIENTATION=-